MGSEPRLLRASVIRGCDTVNPESIRSLPSLPVRTAIFPPEPSSTLILRRSVCVSIFAFAAESIIVWTMPFFCAETKRGAKTTAAALRLAKAMKRRRDNCDGPLFARSSSTAASIWCSLGYVASTEISGFICHISSLPGTDFCPHAVLFVGFFRQSAHDRDVLNQVLGQAVSLLQIFRAVV